MTQGAKIPAIGGELRRIMNANMSEARARRRARDAFREHHLNLDHVMFQVPIDGVKVKESYEKNSKGLEIFSKSWLPETSSPKAVVCFCHGYGDTCTFFFEGVARKLALSGYGVFAMDYPGFGLSEGLHGYIPSFDGLVGDVIEHYSKVKGKTEFDRCSTFECLIARMVTVEEKPEFRNLPNFLFGESMGGAVALKIHFKQPKAWSGAVLLAPMCKIADNMVPPKIVQRFLIGIANLFPKLKMVPQKDLADLAFKDAKKKQMASYNVVAYKGKPRLQTAVQLLKTTQEIEQQLEKVSLPVLILHGEADIVTDPSVSKALYEKASSSDKRLVMYEGAYHCLLEGEADDMIIQVLTDIALWLDERS